MGSLFGDIKQLRASERIALEKLALRRSTPSELIDADLAKKLAQMANSLGKMLAVLIGRDGRVVHLILGAKQRLYLPDLGRFRLEESRLRRLRLVVFAPEGAVVLRPIERDSAETFGANVSLRRNAKSRTGESLLPKSKRSICPEMPADFITDLEKLRLDLVGLVAVSGEGLPAQVSVAYLHAEGGAGTYSRDKSERSSVSYLNAPDIYGLDLDFENFIKELESSFRQNRPKGYETGKDHAVLVGAYAGDQATAKSSMAELHELARTADIQVLDTVIQRRRSLDPQTVIGKGKVEELVLRCLDLGADLLIFDRELSPGQLRSISYLTELRVIDRSMLILDIFSQRAKSAEGRVQVELAQLKYSLPRLTDRDTGLSRLTGGIGGRGPGETKLEVSRRRARDRIAELERRIEKLAGQRGLRRLRRQNRGVPVVAIVGYTNAGKSTLLNALTKGDVLAESKLFATLDPTSKRMRFPNEKEVIFVDTVGFIRELPKELVNAFRATLEEVGEADVLVHVVDASNPEARMQHEVVEETINSLGFEGTPRITLLNKCDLLSPLESSAIGRAVGGMSISATRREGFQDFIAVLQQLLASSFSGQDPGRFTELEQWPGRIG